VTPAVILCLDEPLTSLLLFLPPPRPQPLLRSHSPPLYLIAYSLFFFVSGGLKALISTLTMPKHFHEQGELEENISF